MDGVADFATWKDLQGHRLARATRLNKSGGRCLLSITGAQTPTGVRAQVMRRRQERAEIVARKATGRVNAGNREAIMRTVQQTGPLQQSILSGQAGAMGLNTNRNVGL